MLHYALRCVALALTLVATQRDTRIDSESILSFLCVASLRLITKISLKFLIRTFCVSQINGTLWTDLKETIRPRGRRCSISGYRVLEEATAGCYLCERQSWCSWTLVPWIDCTKTAWQWTLACNGLQLAKQLDSQEDIFRVIVTDVSSRVCFWLLAFTGLVREGASKLMNLA